MTRLQYLLNHQLLMEKYLMVEVLEQVFFIKKLIFISLFDQIYLFNDKNPIGIGPTICICHLLLNLNKYENKVPKTTSKINSINKSNC